MKRAFLSLWFLCAACGTDTIVAVRDSEQTSVPQKDGGQPPRQDGSTGPPPPPTAWRANGGRIVDTDGNPVTIRAVTWTGFEAPTYLPEGIWLRPLDDILQRIVELGFNTVRLPFCNELLKDETVPQIPNANQNGELLGKKGSELLTHVIDRAGAKGLRVILVHNRSDSSYQEDLWYTSDYPRTRFRDDWTILAFTYASARHVVGFELHEGLRAPATWGDGNPLTDWRLAAQDVGNAILERNKNVLVIVNGVHTVNGAAYVPGGDLGAARDLPVQLSDPTRLVYGAADYPPDVVEAQSGDLTRFPWLVDPTFPANLPAFWNARWGYLSAEGTAPVMLTSFGTRYQSETDKQWLRTMIAFLQERDLSFAYWMLNPTLEVGLLDATDWNTTRENYDALRPLLGR